jgi:hypothetical protein
MLLADPSIPLPAPLAHLPHPPTRVLYISNLRRPLLLADLHAYLSCSALPDVRAQLPFANASYPGLWLSGVKDHAYAGYESAEDAIATAIRVHGTTWPEGTGAPLEVQFVDPAQVPDLIRREAAAWTDGRQRLALTLNDGLFGLESAGAGGPQPGRLAFGLARGGPAGQVPVRGPAADREKLRSNGPTTPYARLPGRDRPGNGVHAPSGRGALRYTRTRPTLAYREGPGAAKA